MERLIRSQAKELAGVFYHESKRSAGFRKAFPTFNHYMKGLWVQSDGSIKVYRPGWLHHVELARKTLRAMLTHENVHQNLKDAIYDALLRDGKSASQPQAMKLTQAPVLH